MHYENDYLFHNEIYNPRQKHYLIIDVNKSVYDRFLLYYKNLRPIQKTISVKTFIKIISNYNINNNYTEVIPKRPEISIHTSFYKQHFHIKTR